MNDGWGEMSYQKPRHVEVALSIIWHPHNNRISPKMIISNQTTAIPTAKVQLTAYIEMNNKAMMVSNVQSEVQMWKKWHYVIHGTPKTT